MPIGSATPRSVSQSYDAARSIVHPNDGDRDVVLRPGREERRRPGLGGGERAHRLALVDQRRGAAGAGSAPGTRGRSTSRSRRRHVGPRRWRRPCRPRWRPGPHPISCPVAGLRIGKVPPPEASTSLPSISMRGVAVIGAPPGSRARPHRQAAARPARAGRRGGSGRAATDRAGPSGRAVPAAPCRSRRRPGRSRRPSRGRTSRAATRSRRRPAPSRSPNHEPPMPSTSYSWPALVLDAGPLLPEADHHLLLLVHHGGDVVVVPAVEAGHLGAQRPVTDLLAADGHEVLVGGVHPAVGRVLGVEVGEGAPVARLLGGAVGRPATASQNASMPSRHCARPSVLLDAQRHRRAVAHGRGDLVAQ